MAETYDVAVVGLGALGSAAAWSLASRGHSVVGLERFALGHSRGASHDTSRILRHSYHTPSYVRLTEQAYDDWARLEAASGESLVTVVGGLDLFPPDPAIGLSDYTSSLTSVGIPFSLLSSDEIVERWPQFTVPSGTVGLFQSRGAIVPAARGAAAMRRLAASHGAVLLDESPVSMLRSLVGGGVEVRAGDTSYHCSSVVVCADAWTNSVLASLGLQIPLTVTLEQATYFEPPSPSSFEPGRLPLWIWMDEPSYYGFPCYGEATVKAAQDCGGPVVDPDNRGVAPSQELLSRLASFMGTLLPGSGPPVRSLRCQYTLTPDRDFVLDAVPGLPSVVVGLGAAHGFKFAPTFGRLLADLVEGGDVGFDVTPFRCDRPGLTDPDFEPEWMV